MERERERERERKVAKKDGERDLFGIEWEERVERARGRGCGFVWNRVGEEGRERRCFPG